MTEPTFEGFPVAAFEMVDTALWYTLVPAGLAIGAQLIHNLNDPVAQAQIKTINEKPSLFSYEALQGMVGQDETQYTVAGVTLDQSFLIYIGVYFGTLFGGLGNLMVYNLLAMFGLDKKIGDFGKSLVDWWTTPPTEEELAQFEEGNPSNEEDDDMMAAEAEEKENPDEE